MAATQLFVEPSAANQSFKNSDSYKCFAITFAHEAVDQKTESIC